MDSLFIHSFHASNVPDVMRLDSNQLMSDSNKSLSLHAMICELGKNFDALLEKSKMTRATFSFCTTAEDVRSALLSQEAFVQIDFLTLAAELICLVHHAISPSGMRFYASAHGSRATEVQSDRGSSYSITLRPATSSDLAQNQGASKYPSSASILGREGSANQLQPRDSSSSLHSDRRLPVIDCAEFRISSTIPGTALIPMSCSWGDSPRANSLNSYTILSHQGDGTYGVVYLATKDATKELRAIKIISRDRTVFTTDGAVGAQTADASAGRREAEILKKLRHRHIVQLYEVLDNPEFPDIYLVLEYASRGSVSRIKENGTYQTVREPRLRRLMRQVASAVSYLHHHNVIHRDIKPENILLRQNDNVALTDFGVSERGVANYIDGVSGTPAFIAPELQEEEATATGIDGPAVDMWALGVTFFALKFGYLPSYALVSPQTKTMTFTELNFPASTSLQWRLFFRWILDPDPRLRMTISELRSHEILMTCLPPSPHVRKIVSRFVRKMKLRPVSIFNRSLNHSMNEGTSPTLDTGVQSYSQSVLNTLGNTGSSFELPSFDIPSIVASRASSLKGPIVVPKSEKPQFSVKPLVREVEKEQQKAVPKLIRRGLRPPTLYRLAPLPTATRAHGKSTTPPPPPPHFPLIRSRSDERGLFCHTTMQEISLSERISLSESVQLRNPSGVYAKLFPLPTHVHQ